jgi:hypothetical protein
MRFVSNRKLIGFAANNLDIVLFWPIAALA